MTTHPETDVAAMSVRE